MTFSFKTLVLFVFLSHFLYSFSCIHALGADTGLDIKADSGDTNLQTSISRLQGNVILKHGQLIVTGENAEIQPADDNNPQIYIISGEPVKFDQQTDDLKITVDAAQLVYTPARELMEFQENISLVQFNSNSQFEITATELIINLEEGKPDKILATGNPITFKHKLPDKKIVIKAIKITWDALTQLAVLHKASVQEGLTTFSAEIINYNAVTGDISASGDGNTRPNYRYDPEQKKEPNKANDS